MAMMHLVIRGRWKSPGHSKDRRKDDSHEIKRKILSEVKVRVFEKEVGRNPDLDIDPATERVVLKGRGDYSKKIFVTEIDANDHFVQFFLTTSDIPSIFIRELLLDEGHYYAIPPDLKVLELVLDHILAKDEFSAYAIEIVY